MAKLNRNFRLLSPAQRQTKIEFLEIRLEKLVEQNQNSRRNQTVWRNKIIKQNELAETTRAKFRQRIEEQQDQLDVLQATRRRELDELRLERTREKAEDIREDMLAKLARRRATRDKNLAFIDRLERANAEFPEASEEPALVPLRGRG